MQLTTSGKDVLVLTPDTAQYLHTFTLAEVPFPSIPPARGTLAPVWSSAVFLALGIQKQWVSLCLGATTKLQPASCWCFLGLDFSSECFKEQPVHLSTGSENGHLEARGWSYSPHCAQSPPWLGGQQIADPTDNSLPLTLQYAGAPSTLLRKRTSELHCQRSEFLFTPDRGFELVNTNHSCLLIKSLTIKKKYS